MKTFYFSDGKDSKRSGRPDSRLPQTLLALGMVLWAQHRVFSLWDYKVLRPGTIASFLGPTHSGFLSLV